MGRSKEQPQDQLTPIDRVRLARDPTRPQTLDYIEALVRDFFEIHGDRRYADDDAIITGLGYMGRASVVIAGHQRGRSTTERLRRNFGRPHPEGYRKVARVFELADRFDLPIITFIDTQGAEPGIGAEERGQAEAIAANLSANGAGDGAGYRMRHRRGRLRRSPRTRGSESGADAGERVLCGYYARGLRRYPLARRRPGEDS